MLYSVGMATEKEVTWNKAGVLKQLTSANAELASIISGIVQGNFDSSDNSALYPLQNAYLIKVKEAIAQVDGYLTMENELRKRNNK